MKKTVLLLTACLVIGKAAAQESANEQNSLYQEQEMQSLTPTFLDDVYVNDFWGSNWFVSAKGGMSAFIGKPVGHGDFFDRTKEMLSISAGKWFTPHIAGRIAFQGLKLIDSNIKAHNYKSLHVDVMYNVAAHLRRDHQELPKWDFMPYAGCGVITNSYDHRKPFAISFGIITRYRVAEKLHISAEIGNTMTWQNYDTPQGSANKLGDNLLQASIGFDLTIGKAGWKRVEDPKPYIYQNDWLLEQINQMQKENAKLQKEHMKDALSLKEMRKILEIEGLLDKYDLAMYDGNEVKTQPKNNYSGLNSLRARLRNKGWNGDEDNYKPVLKENFVTNNNDSTEVSPEDYFHAMKDGKIFVGSPIFFFFKLAKDELTEQAQIINIKEVASTIKKYGLCARIVGAADSQTGTAYLNEKLSQKRAEYIAKLLKENGVGEDRINIQFRGGISVYEPQTGNRNTCVMLYFKEN